MPDLLEAPESTIATPAGVDRPAPDKSSPGGTTPPTADAKPDALETLLARYNRSTAALAEFYTPKVDAAEQAATAARGAEQRVFDTTVKPGLQGVRDAAGVVRAAAGAVPSPLPEPRVPDTRGRSFLAVDGGAAVGAVIQGLGLLAQLAMAGGAPTVALGALTGAMNGWAKGDQARADADWQRYLATVDSIRHENAQALKSWQAVMEASGTNLTQAQARLAVDMAEQGQAARAAEVAQLGVDSAYKRWQAEQKIVDGVFDRTEKLLNHQAMEQLRQATLANTAAFQQAQLALSGRKQDEVKRANLEKERLKREAGADIFKNLPAGVKAELLTDPEVKKSVEGGEGITSDQIAAALGRINEKALARAREQGLNAANIPQRTPTESLRRLEDLTLAQSYIAEMDRLATSATVKLDRVVGGIRPWFNQIAQTGKVGPFPVSEPEQAKLTSDERRFLALTQDYADTILRLRSGAAINESEFRRMLQFIPDQSVTPQTFMARTKLQADLLQSKKAIINAALRGGGYRAPEITPAPLGGKTPEQRVAEQQTLKVRRKKDGLRGTLILEPGEKIPPEYEVVK